MTAELSPSQHPREDLQATLPRSDSHPERLWGGDLSNLQVMIQHYFKAIDVMKDLFIPVHSSVHSYVHWPRLSLSGMAAELSPSQHIDI